MDDVWLLHINAVTGNVMSHNISGPRSPGHGECQRQQRLVGVTEVAGTINIDTDSHLRFSGGDLAHPNLMSGGTINGPGVLGSLTDQKLSGWHDQ